MKRMMWIVVCVFAMALGVRNAGAQSESAQLEDLRREVKSLRAELQALRLALSELAELDRQRASVIARALEGALTGKVASVVAERDGNERDNGRDGNGRGREGKEAKEAKESPARKDAELTTVSQRTRDADAPRVSKTSARKENNNNGGASNNGAGGTVVGKVEVPSGEPVAYVYVENVPGGSVRGQSVTIEQSKKNFVPNWAVIQKGTTIKFPNLDNVYHNVFSRSPGNSFDLGLYNSSEDAKAHTFYEAGPVDVYCNIHPRMAASVLVVPNRHFVKVKADGSFQLSDVPAGKRKIVAWAPGSNVSSEWVELGGGDQATVALKLEPKSGSHKNKEGRSYGSYE